ncbi:MAG TPA: glycerophosphodiester phosphodiesterase [Gemmatimonadaceae bacterium]
MHPLLDITHHPVIGHRGNSAHAPENTIEAFRQAVELGVDALELDVRLTADGTVVVVHDATLDRTTDRTGGIAALTLSDVQAADAGAGFVRNDGTAPYRGRGIIIPTLDEVLETFPTTPLLIEIKTARAAVPTRLTIERHAAAGRCVVASFIEEAMHPFRGGPIPIGATRRDTMRHLAPAVLGIPIRHPRYQAMSIPRWYRGWPVPVGRFARALRGAGVPVHVWTVDDPTEARSLWSAGICGILTNDPARILGARPN